MYQDTHMLGYYSGSLCVGRSRESSRGRRVYANCLLHSRAWRPGAWTDTNDGSNAEQACEFY